MQDSTDAGPFMDSDVQLSSHALAALQEFMVEQQQQTQLPQEALSKLPTSDASTLPQLPLSMDCFGEDWKLSQFWYTDDTAEFVARQALKHSPTGPIAMMCAPSAFVMLKRLDQGADNAFILDYDTRFGVYGNAFVHYDYRDPLVLSQLTPLKGQFKFIVLDPPYLEEKCFTRVAETVQYLAAPDCKVLACTGYMVRGLVRRLLHSNITTFEPRHRNGLANQFCTYTNYEDDDLKWAQGHEW